MIDEYKKNYPEQYKYENKYWKRYLKLAKDSFCIDDTDLYLNSGLDDNYIGKLINVAFYIDNLQKLYSMEGEDRIFISYFGTISYPKYHLTMGNKNQPYIKNLEVEIFPLTSTNILVIDLFIQKMKVKRDISDLFNKNIINYEFYTIEKTKTKINLNSSLIYNLNFIMNKSNLVISYSYKYLSFSDVISSFGGSFKVYLLLMKMIYSFIIKYDFDSFLVSSIFLFYRSVNEEEKEEKRKELVKSFVYCNIVNNKKPSVEDKEELKEYLRSELSHKYKYTISSWDIISIKVKRLLKRPLSKDEIILEKAYFFICNEFSYVNILRQYLNVITIKDYLFSKSANIFNFPPLDLARPSKINRIFDYITKKEEMFNMTDDELEEIINSDMTIEKNRRRLEILIDI